MNTIPPTACDLANYLSRKVHRPDETINLMKLNALLYYAEACSLAMFDRELTHEVIEAWDHGPVFPSLWERLKHKGWNDLAVDERCDATPLDPEISGLLDDVYQAYGGYSLPELEKKIKQDTPWKEARRGLPAWDLSKKPLNKATMATFYKQAFEAESQASAEQATRTLRTQKLGVSYSS